MSATTVFNLAPCCNRHCSHLNLIGLFSASYCLRTAVLESSHSVQVSLFLTEFRGLSDTQLSGGGEETSPTHVLQHLAGAGHHSIRLVATSSIISPIPRQLQLLCVRVLTSRVS